ncbi:winged helix DNA-binding domain-containing protein [Actinotalea sp.]|uniref:winged helix DNA-binding domain-containing protein n=1 Tax=Actinotalea sp. TaxID=1872145 RepID=UPI00356B5E53
MAPEVCLLRLVAQHVAGPPLADPVTAARHLLAAQGQDAAGVVRSLAVRSRARSGQEVLDAYDAGTLVRSWPMRGSLHTVAAEDLGWLQALASGRPRAAAARRRGQLGLEENDVTTAERVSERVAVDGIVRADLLAAFRSAGLPTDAGRGYHLIVELAQRGRLCLGPLLSGEQAFILADAWIGSPRRLEGEEALAELVQRYLLGHGPATVADLARWAGLPLGSVRSGLAAVRDRLELLEVDGTEYWLDPSVPDRLATHRADACRVHLLPGFDEMILGYADRTATVPPEHSERIVPGGNGVFRPTVLVDGIVVGTWRRTRTGVEVEPFGTWRPEVQDEVRRAVDALP